MLGNEKSNYICLIWRNSNNTEKQFFVEKYAKTLKQYTSDFKVLRKWKKRKKDSSKHFMYIFHSSVHATSSSSTTTLYMTTDFYCSVDF